MASKSMTSSYTAPSYTHTSSAQPSKSQGKQEIAANLTLTPGETSRLLTKAIKAKEPIMLVGAPGVGKSDIVAKACRDVDADLIIMHPVVSDPTDYKGLPFCVNGEAEFLPFGELKKILTAKKPTVCFLDDLGQAAPAVQAAAMQLLLAREINGQKVSDHVCFIAASNRRTDRAGVSGILEPVKSRFTAIIHLEPAIADWRMWAVKEGNVREEIIAFLSFRPELLCNFQPTQDIQNSPVPRTWAAASRLLGLELEPQHRVVAVAGAIGSGAAVEFEAFLRSYEQLPDIDLILTDPASQEVPKEISVLYALSTALALRATKQNAGRIFQFLEMMLDTGAAEFSALTLKLIAVRDAKICQGNPSFTKAMSGPLGKLLSGE